jgi:hypothetical protein
MIKRTTVSTGIAKGFTMVDGLCAIQILQRPFARRGLYASRYGSH